MNSTLNTTTASTTPASVQPEPSRMAMFTTSSAMALLWKKSCKQMTAKELEWFADGAIEQVGMNIRALSDVLEGTACLVSSDSTSGGLQDTDSTSSLLFNLHNQLDAIAGLADIANAAGAMARRAAKKKGGAA